MNYPVWYLETEKKKGSAVLITVRKLSKDGNELASEKRLVTAQHNLRTVGLDSGPFSTSIKAWPPGSAFGPDTERLLEVDYDLTVRDETDWHLSQDFAFLRFKDPAAALYPTASMLQALDLHDESSGFAIVGFRDGVDRFILTEGIVTYLLLHGWNLERVNDPIGIVSGGTGNPSSGQSGGGVFFGLKLAGVFVAGSSATEQQAFISISLLHRWCEERGYALVSSTIGAPSPPKRSPLLPPGLRAAFEAELQAKLFLRKHWTDLSHDCPFYSWDSTLDTSSASRTVVDQCEEQPHGTGFETLLAALDRRDHDTRQLYKLVDSSPGMRSCVSYAELKQLRKLHRLQPVIDEAKVIQAFVKVRGIVGSPPIRDFDHTVGYLGRLNHEHADHGPLLEFLALCRIESPQLPVNPPLEAWESKVAKRLGINLNSFKRSDSSGALACCLATQPHVPILQVRVKPGEFSATPNYSIQAWIHEFDTVMPLEDIEFQSEKPLTEGIGAALLAGIDMANAVVRSHSAHSHMWIEVILPNELLGIEIDSVKHPSGESPDAIGSTWPVMIRPYDRIYETHERLVGSHPLWRQKWEAFHSNSMPDDVPCAYTEADFTESFFQNANAMAALTLGEEADTQQMKASASLINLLAFGVPTAVWLRKHEGLPLQSHALLQEILLSKDRAAWPLCARTIRQEWFGDDCLLAPKCSGLSFLWDDPDRMPPDAGRPTLLAPSQRSS